MKKILFAATLLVASVATASAQLSFGVNAGYDNVTLKSKATSGSTTDITKTDLNGFHVGPTISYGFNQVEGLSLNAAVLYQMAAKSEKETYMGVEATNSLTHHAVQVPIRASYQYKFGSDFGVFGFAGPKFNIGIAETSKLKATVGDTDYVIKADSYSGKTKSYENGDKKSETDGGDTDYSRFDLQLGLGAGVSYQNLYLTVGYDFGMLNLYTGDGKDNFKLHNNQLQVSVGYCF